MTAGAWTSEAPHPVLQAQQAAKGGFVPEAVFHDVGEAIDSTPRFVAGFVLGAALVLVALKKAGFRFNFGAGVKVG